MMEPVRFADILFTLLVCVVTFGILTLVNRKKTVGKSKPQQTVAASEQNGTETKPKMTDEE
jgi:hypothetical protein